MNAGQRRPRVSVLLPVRNGLPFLREAVTSILTQQFRDLELIVVDDGSTDGSARAVLDANDPRVRLVAGDGRGIARALNAGLAVAQGEYVARQDADDLSAPDRLLRQAAFLDRHSEVAVLASRVRFIDDQGGAVANTWTRAVARQWDQARTPAAIAALMPRTCCIVHGSVMARRRALVEVGGYDDTLPVAQDYDLWLRLLPHHGFARLPERLYSFRLHSKQVSATCGAEQAFQAVAAKLRHLRRAMPLPPAPRICVIGGGAGRDIYHRALSSAPWVPVSADTGWDVAAFTAFDRLETDILRVRAHARQPLVRVGNFLVATAVSGATA